MDCSEGACGEILSDVCAARERGSAVHALPHFIEMLDIEVRLVLDLPVNEIEIRTSIFGVQGMCRNSQQKNFVDRRDSESF